MPTPTAGERKGLTMAETSGDVIFNPSKVADGFREALSNR